jgi:hypothetical protein
MKTTLERVIIALSPENPGNLLENPGEIVIPYTKTRLHVAHFPRFLSFGSRRRRWSIDKKQRMGGSRRLKRTNGADKSTALIAGREKKSNITYEGG